MWCSGAALSLVTACCAVAIAQPLEEAPVVAPAEPPPPDVTSALADVVEGVQLHGFVTQGAFVSTSNDYIGRSSQGSLELFEAGVNASSQLGDRLRAGVQLFARNVGDFDSPVRFDWAYLDYRLRPWLGVRAGIIKMPFGLYNEYVDIDASRAPILLPQSIYLIRNRDALLAHHGFTLYGNVGLGGAGELDYQAWMGTLEIPENALVLQGATLERATTRYITGAQLFWTPPVANLRIGATAIRASIDFDVRVDAQTVAALVDAGLVAPDFDGGFVVSQRPSTWIVGSAEYTRGDTVVAAEYARTSTRQRTTIPALLPTTEEESERFYAMITHRFARWLEVAGYYSVEHKDANDRRGRDPKWMRAFHAWQRDASLTLRFDVNDHWLWKIEGHFIDGTAQLTHPDPERYWGLFLVRTTVTF